MSETRTNITDEMARQFDDLTSGRYNNLCLMSCFCNGEPTAAICVVEFTEGELYHIKPMFIAVTPGMKLVDHDGNEPDGKVQE